MYLQFYRLYSQLYKRTVYLIIFKNYLSIINCFLLFAAILNIGVDLSQILQHKRFINFSDTELDFVTPHLNSFISCTSWIPFIWKELKVPK
jgi:hypothetical protein